MSPLYLYKVGLSYDWTGIDGSLLSPGMSGGLVLTRGRGNANEMSWLVIYNVLVSVQGSRETPRARLSTLLRGIQMDGLQLVSLVTQAALATLPVGY